MFRSIKQFLVGCWRAYVKLFDATLFLWLIASWFSSVAFYPIAMIVVSLEYMFFGTYFNLVIYFGMYILSTAHIDSLLLRTVRFVLAPLIWSVYRSIGSYSCIKDPEGMNVQIVNG